MADLTVLHVLSNAEGHDHVNASVRISRERHRASQLCERLIRHLNEILVEFDRLL